MGMVTKPLAKPPDQYSEEELFHLWNGLKYGEDTVGTRPLSGNEWILILVNYPSLTRLLNLNPETIDKCDLSKLSDIDWAFLVCRKPEFTDRCPWERFTEDGFTYLLHYTGKSMGVRFHWLKLNDCENQKIQSILNRRPKRI